MVVTYTDPQETPQGAKPEPGPRPKRPISEAKWAANSVNASLSKGATSTAGKARAALNAVKHGMTSNTVIFLENELPEEYYDEVNRWAEQLGAANDAEYAHIEMAVYNVWKFRRARNASAVAINGKTRRLRAAYEHQKSQEVGQLIKQLASNATAVVNELQGTTTGLRWLLFMLENVALALMAGEVLDALQRAELIMLFGLMPHTLFGDRDVMQIQLDCLSLWYGQGSLTAAQATELLQDSWGARTPKDFARRIEPHRAGMVTREQARKYLITMIQKRRDALRALLPAAQAREDQELAEQIALAKCDISDPGYRREQYQSMADGLRHRALRDFHTLQATRRKFGTGGSSEDASQEGSQEHGETTAVEDTPAPPTGAAPAAEGADKNDPTVPQATGATEGCGAETLQPDHPRESEFSGTFARIMEMAAECRRRMAEDERRE